MILFIKILTFIASVGNILLGLLVLLKNRKDKLNLTFGLFAIITGLWVGANFGLRLFVNYYLLRSVFALGALVPLFLIVWLYYFREKYSKRFLLFIYLVGIGSILFFFLSFTPNMIVVGNLASTSPFESFNRGPLFNLYALFVSLIIIIPLVVILRLWREAEGIKKLQVKYILLGLIVFAIPTLTVSLILPVFGIEKYSALDSPFSLFFIAFSAYAIIKHRFLDIRFIVRKSFIFVGLAVFVFLAYYLVLWIDNTFFKGPYTVGAYLSAIVIAPLFLLAFNYFSKYLKKTANQYFFTGLYDYQEVLETFARKISKSIRF